jgi:hypothetical protein
MELKVVPGFSSCVILAFRAVLGGNYIKELKAIAGRGGAFTFAPPPGYTVEKVGGQRGGGLLCTKRSSC